MFYISCLWKPCLTRIHNKSGFVCAQDNVAGIILNMYQKIVFVSFSIKNLFFSFLQASEKLKASRKYIFLPEEIWMKGLSLSSDWTVMKLSCWSQSSRSVLSEDTLWELLDENQGNHCVETRSNLNKMNMMNMMRLISANCNWSLISSNWPLSYNSQIIEIRTGFYWIL